MKKSDGKELASIFPRGRDFIKKRKKDWLCEFDCICYLDSSQKNFFMEGGSYLRKKIQSMIGHHWRLKKSKNLLQLQEKSIPLI